MKQCKKGAQAQVWLDLLERRKLSLMFSTGKQLFHSINIFKNMLLSMIFFMIWKVLIAEKLLNISISQALGFWWRKLKKHQQGQQKSLIPHGGGVKNPHQLWLQSRNNPGTVSHPIFSLHGQGKLCPLLGLQRKLPPTSSWEGVMVTPCSTRAEAMTLCPTLSAFS